MPLNFRALSPHAIPSDSHKKLYGDTQHDSTVLISAYSANAQLIENQGLSPDETTKDTDHGFAIKSVVLSSYCIRKKYTMIQKYE